jgi:hypothetical protein
VIVVLAREAGTKKIVKKAVGISRINHFFPVLCCVLLSFSLYAMPYELEVRKE